MKKNKDFEKIQSYINPLMGQKTWGVSIGIGSFITMEFGKTIFPEEEGGRIYGEWHFWVYCCAWRLEKNDKVLVCSEDLRGKIEQEILCLEGLKLEAATLLSPTWDIVLKFSKGFVLRTFCIYSEEYEHWMLYTPNGNTLIVGPGTNWNYKNSSAY